MSHRLVRRVTAKALGIHLPMPLRQWLVDLYGQIDFIDNFKYFILWLKQLDKMPAIYRRSGVKYDIANHWHKAIQDTPMEFFDAAATELKDWRNIFLKVDSKNEQEYKEFWKWSGPNPYQVQIWLAEVLRKFINALWKEHSQKLEEQRNPEGHGQEPDHEEGEDIEPSADEAESWKETEALEKKLLEREKQQEQQERSKRDPTTAP